MFLLKSKKRIFPLIAALIIAFQPALVLAQADDVVKDSFSQEIISLTNESRFASGAGILKKSDILTRAAQMKAEDMVAHGYFAHTSPQGVSPWHWFYKAGYKPSLAGENLALAYSESAAIVDAWLASPSHKKNLLNKEFTEIGIGIAKGEYQGKEMVFVVQVFGVQGK